MLFHTNLNLIGTNKWFKVNHLEKPNGWDKKDWLAALGQLAVFLLFVSVSSILLSQTVRSWLFVRLHVCITFLMRLIDRCRNAHKYRSVSGGKLRKVVNPSRPWYWQYFLHMGENCLVANSAQSWEWDVLTLLPTLYFLLSQLQLFYLLWCASMCYYLDYWEAFPFFFLGVSLDCMGS